MRPVTFDSEEFGDELSRALRLISPIYAEAVIARIHGERLPGVPIGTFGSRVMRGRRQLRRVLAGETVRWRALNYCRIHGHDTPYVVVVRPSGRRRRCVACEAERAVAGHPPRDTCRRCGGEDLVLRHHNVTGRSWLACRACETARMAAWRNANRERSREAYRRQGVRRRARNVARCVGSAS